MVVDSPLEIMPVAIVHVFVVGVSTVFLRFHNVDWVQLFKMIKVMAVPVVFGLFGLITIPENWLLLLVFGVVNPGDQGAQARPARGFRFRPNEFLPGLIFFRFLGSVRK